MTNIVVKERPIIFSTELIPKVLDGTKTQTRRTWGLEFVNQDPDAFEFLRMEGDLAIFQSRWSANYSVSGSVPLRSLPKIIEDNDPNVLFYIKCPYGQVGDMLYMKETWAIAEPPLGQECGDIIKGSLVGFDLEYLKLCEILYKADGTDNETGWRSPRFMPRWASRKTFTIAEVRAERLQDITEEDARAEGVEALYKIAPNTFGAGYIWDNQIYRRGFKEKWDSINPKHPWKGNPWVWPLGWEV